MLSIFAAIALDALFSAPTLAGAHAGALVVDAQTGRTVYARDPDADFVPASTMKLIVGSAALDELGTAFSFTTTLATDGTTLYLRGGGDVFLSQADADDAAMTIHALDMNAFPGGITADTTHFNSPPYPDGWQVDDLPNDYAAPISALSFNDNALRITLTPALPGQAPTLSTQPQSTLITLHNDATTGQSGTPDSSDVRFDWSARDTLEVVGSVPANAPAEIDAALLDPAAIASDVFAQTFARNNIAIGPGRRIAPAPASARVLWQHRSQQLPHILAAMWLPSDNIIAETLLEELGAAREGSADTRAAGIASERAWLQSLGIEPRTVTIGDGSGMSIYDRVTPRALTTILMHDWRGPNRASVLDALPAVGERGDLQERFAGAGLEGIVVAKTGATMHNRALAGYVTTARGTFIFALLVNNWMDTGAGANERLYAFQARFLQRIRDGAGGVP